MIDVLVVDDHEMFLEALTLLLGREPEVRLVGGTRGADEALRICEEEQPDVVLMDLDLPDGGGVEATRRIRQAFAEIKVVVLTELQSPAVVAAALAAGASGYVPKTRAIDELMDVVRRAAAGELIMPAADLAPVLEELRSGQGVPVAELALQRLTPRETEILAALAAGDSTGQVADSLGISAMTVQSHVKSILAKLGVHSKIEAVTLAWRHGFTSTSRSA